MKKLLLLCVALTFSYLGIAQTLPAPTPQLTVQYRVIVIQNSFEEPKNFTQADEDFIMGVETSAQIRFVSGNEPLLNGQNPEDYKYYEHSGITFQRIGCVHYVESSTLYDRVGNFNWQQFAGNFVDNAINIFFVNDPAESKDGVALSSGNSQKAVLLNAYKKRNNPGGAAAVGATLAHEYGHILGLRHAWNANAGNFGTPENDYFTDMYYLENRGWCDSGHPVCGNNLMAYNPSNEHMSPQQVDKMRSRLLGVSSNLLATESASGELVIDTDETWPFGDDRLVHQDLRVKSGKTLTVESCVSFTEGRKVIVEEGGHLILDGGQMSTKFFPQKTHRREAWDGIMAHGRPDMSQTDVNQARVTLRYNEKHNTRPNVSAARAAIKTGRTVGDNNWGGAIVDVSDADFKNNKRDIHLAPYSAPGSGTYRNLSKVYRSDFTTTWRMSRELGGFKQSILLDNVNGIVIQRCDFITSASTHKLAEGVTAIKSDFQIIDCSFENYYRGVSNTGTGSQKFEKYEIHDSDFIANSVGIEVFNISDKVWSRFSISNCRFAIGKNPKNSNTADSGVANHGVLIRRAPVYLWGNDFVEVNSTERTVGIELVNTLAKRELFVNSGNGTITKTRFWAVSTAILFSGQNYLSSNPDIGPHVQCNNFQSCNRSIYIKPHEDDLGASGVGDLLAQIGFATNNTFDNSLAPNYILNQTNKLVTVTYRPDVPAELPTVAPLSGPVNLMETKYGICTKRRTLDDGGKEPTQKSFSGGNDLLEKPDINTDVSIYPNPGSSLYLGIRGTSKQLTHYSIMSATGQSIVAASPLTDDGINVSVLKAGLYFISFHTASGRTVTKKYIRN